MIISLKVTALIGFALRIILGILIIEKKNLVLTFCHIYTSTNYSMSSYKYLFQITITSKDNHNEQFAT